MADEFYPTEPALARDKKLNDNYPSTSERQARKRAAKGDKEQITRAQVLTDVNTAVSRTQGAVNTVEEAGEVATGEVEISEYEATRMQNTDASTEVQQDSTLAQLRQIRQRKPAEIQVSETVQYFRRLARTPSSMPVVKRECCCCFMIWINLRKLRSCMM